MNQPSGVEKKLEEKAAINGRIALALAVAAACGTGSMPAFAQDQEEATGLDEIIVTARFREEKLQETPIAITAITADARRIPGPLSRRIAACRRFRTSPPWAVITHGRRASAPLRRNASGSRSMAMMR